MKGGSIQDDSLFQSTGGHHVDFSRGERYLPTMKEAFSGRQPEFNPDLPKRNSLSDDQVRGRVIDLENYPRRRVFDAFKDREIPTYSITSLVNITEFKPFAKELGHGFFVPFSFLLSKAVNAVPEFRQRIVDGKIREFERVHPATPSFSRIEPSLFALPFISMHSPSTAPMPKSRSVAHSNTRFVIPERNTTCSSSRISHGSASPRSLIPSISKTLPFLFFRWASISAREGSL